MRLDEASTADQAGRTEQAPSPRRRTVLVVDDEPDMVENLARIFRRSPYACLTAASGQDALALLERERPDLLLTDLRMPGVDGLTLVRHARRLAPATLVVIFTAFASDSAEQEAINAGAVAFLVKPFTAAQLLSTVQMVLRSAGEERTRARPDPDPKILEASDGGLGPPPEFRTGASSPLSGTAGGS